MSTMSKLRMKTKTGEPEQETVTEYLKRRHVNFELHRPIVDEVERTATFYLWTLSGALVGYQTHRPDRTKKDYQKYNPRNARYFTYRPYPAHSVWGVESLHQGHGPVFLTEGVFDAARLTELGASALAVCCNNPPKDLRNWLQMLQRPVVVVCDNDEAGLKLAKFGDYAEVVPVSGQDLGEAPDDYVRHLLCKWAAATAL